MKMPELRAIAGHTNCNACKAYLEKKNRAIARDLYNMTSENWNEENDLSTFRWDIEMNETRKVFGNNKRWRNTKRCRRYEHFIISPDPTDNIDLEHLRTLAQGFVNRHFGDYQVAIIYHDDNQNNIPHAHVVVNNTNLKTGNRLHLNDAEVIALNQEIQDHARQLKLSAFDNLDHRRKTDEKVTPKQKAKAKQSGKNYSKAQTFENYHTSRAEKNLHKDGRYSWLSDLRNRVELAKSTSINKQQFIKNLQRLGVEVIPNASGKDYLYTLQGTSKKATGLKLGYEYSKERMQERFAMQTGYTPSRQSIRELIKQGARCIEINDMAQLRQVAQTARICNKYHIRSLEDFTKRLDAFERKGKQDSQDYILLINAQEYCKAKNIVPRQLYHDSRDIERYNTQQAQAQQEQQQRKKNKEQQR